ncbi:Ig-like domain-containing protein, partial [Flavobacterium sp. SM15]|uniref:Ig-like domain-containing protein n=1 Tax=Flavobacterium sp. SM15 TaxID=2908005 RepID=UPI001EDC1591
MKRILTLFFVLILTSTVVGQNMPNDCVNAVVICGNGTFNSNASGRGNLQEVLLSNPCAGQEHESIWLKIYIAQSGSLGFNLIPNDPALSVDYDFWVYGPNKPCNSLGSPLRCATTNPQAAGMTNNHTGMYSSTVDNFAGPGGDAGDNGIAYVQSLTVTAGQYYYIAIDRPQGDGGFQLQWTGTAALQSAPALNPVRDFIRCSSSATAVLSLADVTSWIFANNSNLTAANTTISYYDTLANAFDGVSPLGGFISTTTQRLVYVKVVNSAFGCSTIGSFNFIKVGIPSANITISDTQICSSQNVTVTFSGTPNAVVEYRVNGGSIQMVTLDATGNYQLITPITADTTYTLVRAKNLDTNGTTICSQLETDTVSVSVLTIPTPSVTTNSPICEGTNAVLTFSGLANAVITYTVDNGANQTVTLDNTGQQQVILTGLTGGSHQIALTNIADSNPPNCSLPLTISETIIVNAQIVASISGSTSVCKDAPQPQITFTGTNGNAPYTFVYTINGGINQSVTTTSGDSVTVNVPTNSIGTFTYDLVSASSATTPVCSYPQTGSASVIVNDIPVINGTLFVCQGGATQLSSPTAQATSNAWMSSDSTIVTVDATGNVSGVSVGTANIIFTDLNGCFNTVTVTVNPIPTGSATPPSDTICSASAPNIVLSGPVSGTTFDWTVVQSGVS